MDDNKEQISICSVCGRFKDNDGEYKDLSEKYEVSPRIKGLLEEIKPGSGKLVGKEAWEKRQNICGEISTFITNTLGKTPSHGVCRNPPGDPRPDCMSEQYGIKKATITLRRIAKRLSS